MFNSTPNLHSHFTRLSGVLSDSRTELLMRFLTHCYLQKTRVVVSRWSWNTFHFQNEPISIFIWLIRKLYCVINHIHSLKLCDDSTIKQDAKRFSLLSNIDLDWTITFKGNKSDHLLVEDEVRGEVEHLGIGVFVGSPAERERGQTHPRVLDQRDLVLDGQRSETCGQQEHHYRGTEIQQKRASAYWAETLCVALRVKNDLSDTWTSI